MNDASPESSGATPEIGDIEGIRLVAENTWREFESKTITPEIIVDALKRCRPDLVRGKDDGEAINEAQKVIDRFPIDACDDTTAVLRDRLGFGEIIVGSYGKDDGGHYDRTTKTYINGFEDYGDRYHSFLDVGRTEFGSHTVVDVAVDQFGGPEVYVGPWRSPWSDGTNYNAV